MKTTRKPSARELIAKKAKLVDEKRQFAEFATSSGLDGKSGLAELEAEIREIGAELVRRAMAAENVVRLPSAMRDAILNPPSCDFNNYAARTVTELMAVRNDYVSELARFVERHGHDADSCKHYMLRTNDRLRYIDEIIERRAIAADDRDEDRTAVPRASAS